MSPSNEIKIVLQRAFMTQTEFAEALHVSFTTVNRWDAGKARPNLSAMKEIKQFCIKIDIEYTNVEKAWLRSKVGEEV